MASIRGIGSDLFRVSPVHPSRIYLGSSDADVTVLGRLKLKDHRVTAIQVLTNAALFCAGVFIPLLAKNEMGAGDFEIGIIVAAYGVSLFVSSFVFGRAADMHGRRPYIVTGLLVSGFACILQLYTPNLPSLLVARVILGLCSGIFPSALAAYAYERGIRMGKFTSHLGLGFGLGSIMAGIIVLSWGQAGHTVGREIYNPVFIGSALMFFICFVIIFRLPFPQVPKFKVPLFPKKIIKDNLAIYASLLIRHSGACAVWAFFALFIYYLQPAGTPQHVRFFWVGVINGVNGVFQYIFMQIIDRFNHHKLIVVGFLTSALTFVAFMVIDSIVELILTQVLLAFAWSCLYVGSICLIMDRNPEHATSAGLLGSTLNGAQVVGPIIGGSLASSLATVYISIGPLHLGGSEIGGYRWIMLGAALMSLLALAVYSLELGREKKMVK